MQTNQSYNTAFVVDMNRYTGLFDKYYLALVFFAARLMRDRKDAEDIVSEIFVKLWEKRENFHAEKPVKAFLYISTRNACFNTIKRKQNRVRKNNQYCLLLNEADSFALNEITRAEVFRELHVLVNGLPPECRKIVVMWMGGFENKEIAEKLQISIHTVKNQVARGIYLMRKKAKARDLLLLL